MFNQKNIVSLFSHEKYKQFPASSDSAILLVHGGCFTDGDEAWNNEQAASIANHCRVNVFTFNFDKSSLQASLSDIAQFFQSLHKHYHGNVGLIGCSSGGFLVMNALRLIPDPSFTLLICPVMDPELRETMLLAQNRNAHNLQLQQQQMQYFKTKPYPVCPSINQYVEVIAADTDENVPLQLILNESKRHSAMAVHVRHADHSLSYKPFEFLNATISRLNVGRVKPVGLTHRT